MNWKSDEKAGELKRNIVSVRLSDMEHRQLSDTAYQQRRSCSDLVRDLVFGSGGLNRAGMSGKTQKQKGGAR